MLILAKSKKDVKATEGGETVDTQDLENLLEPYKPKQKKFNSFEE